MLNLGRSQAGGRSELQGENSLCEGLEVRKKIGSEYCEEILGAWPTASLLEPIFLSLPSSLHSSHTDHLFFLLTCLSHCSPRAFALAVPSAWNALPHLLTQGLVSSSFRPLFSVTSSARPSCILYLKEALITSWALLNPSSCFSFLP